MIITIFSSEHFLIQNIKVFLMKIVGGKKFDKEKMQKATKDKQICNSRHKQTLRLNCNFRSRRTQNIKQILGKVLS